MFSFVVCCAHAQTWSGGGGDNKWSTGANWSLGIAPLNLGIANVIFAGNTRLTPDMDMAWNINSLAFNSGAGAFTLGSTGNFTLTIQGSGITNNSTSTQTINNAITLGAAQTWSAASGNLSFGGNIANGGNLLTISGSSNTSASGVISGTGGLTKSGTGTLTLTGANTYTSATKINAGTLSVSSLANGGSSSNIGASTNAATNLVLNGGTLQYTGAAVSTNRLFSVGTSGGTLDASGSGALNFTNTGSMGFNSQSGTRTLTLTGTNTGSNTLSAVIGDNGGATSLIKNGTGNWVLGGANTYTGTTTINGGDLSTGTFTLSTTATVSIASGATYTSTGTLNLNPDTTAAQTFISGAGTLRLRNSSSSASAPDIYWNPTGSATSGACYQVTIASNIDVGTGTRYFNGISNRNDYERYGGDLVLSGNLSGSANLTFTGTPNTGIAGQTWQMAYTLAGNNSAFTGGIILTDGANLTLNNANALTSANSVTFTPASGAVAGLYLYGRNVTIGALSGTAAGTMNIRNGSLVTDNNATINPGIVRSNSILTIQQDTNTTFNGVISDGPNDHGSGDSGTYYTLGLVKTGTGSLTLGGTNTYTGGTTINGGALVVNSAASLGATSGGLTINAGTLEVATGYSTSRTITLGNAASTIQVDPSQTFTVTSAIGGTGTLNKTGAGTMILTGTDTYSGGTIVSNGILQLGNSGANDENVNSLGSGAVTVNGGGQLSLGGNYGGLVSYTIANNLTLNNGTILSIDGAQHLSGTLTINSGGGTIITQFNGKDVFLDGSVSGSGPLTIDNLAPANYGDGEVHFTGSNSYSGTLTVNNSSGSSHGGRIAVDSNNALANATIVMDGPRDIGFATTAPVFGALSGTGGITLTSGLNLSVGNNNTASTYSGILTGAGSLTKIGTAAWTVSGANSYTGSTSVSAGTLNIQNGTALGTTASGTSVTSGATLQIQGGITVGAEALTLNGTGASGQNGALVNVSGTNNYGGLVTLGSASTISSDSGSLNLTNTGTITGATFGLTLTGAGNGSVSSVIGTTTGTLTKSGAGNWTLTGANSYTGGTTVSAGTLFVNNTTGSGTGSGAITVNGSGTTLGGNGTMTGAVSVASGNNLAPGATGVGSTAILKTGALTLSSGSNFQVDINGITVGTLYDQLGVTGGATITGSNLLVTAAVFTQSDVGNKFAILSNITAGLVSGTFSGLSEGASFNSGSDRFMITYVGNAGDGTNGNDIVLTLTAVPEPSTWAAGLLALFAMIWMGRRRLRRLSVTSYLENAETLTTESGQQMTDNKHSLPP